MKPLGGSQGLQFESLDLLVVWFMVSSSGGKEDMKKHGLEINPKVKQQKFHTGETSIKNLDMSGYRGMHPSSVALPPPSVSFKVLLKAQPQA